MPIPSTATETEQSRRWTTLMAAAQRGHAASYRQLLQEIDPWLRRYYARRLPEALAEDMAQEALIAIHSRRHTYDPARPFAAWMTAIARYKWIDRLRRLAREPTRQSLEESRAQPAVDGHETAVTSALVVGDLLHQLKPMQAEVIRLVKLDGLSIEEASVRTGQSASLVKVNIHRGIARMAASLAHPSH